MFVYLWLSSLYVRSNIRGYLNSRYEISLRTRSTNVNREIYNVSNLACSDIMTLVRRPPSYEDQSNSR